MRKRELPWLGVLRPLLVVVMRCYPGEPAHTRLTEHLHEENLAWTEAFGRPANFAVEPAGEAMWDFMVAVMRAGSVGDMSEIPGQVRDFLVEHRDRLEAGAKEEVPTSGGGSGGSSTPRGRVSGSPASPSLWAMFYGSMRVPNPR
jgi:hypothetical protein